MQIDIITLFPDAVRAMLSYSICQRAQDKGLLRIGVYDLRDWSTNRWRRVDDYPYGGGAGMVMAVEPIARAIEELRASAPYDEIIYTSPDGEQFNQSRANELSLKEHLLILCGHYKGIDQRVRDHYITKEISVGDYVLSGGEPAAGIIVDTIARLIPGAIGDAESALSDSFQDGLLAPPVYTRPAEYNGWRVPEVLLSGNAAKIAAWQEEQALERTKRLRPDLLDYTHNFSRKEENERTH